jgi:single-strand DNA-binding protein
MNFQKMLIMGTLGKDADVRTFANGSSVMTLNVATSENWKDKDGTWQKRTTWHSVKLFGKSVEYVAPKALKGTTVYVEGIINTDEYEKDGVKQYKTYVKAESVKVLSGKQDGYQGKLQAEQSGYDAESIPF